MPLPHSDVLECLTGCSDRIPAPGASDGGSEAARKRALDSAVASGRLRGRSSVFSGRVGLSKTNLKVRAVTLIPYCSVMISLHDLYDFRLRRGIGEWTEHQRIGLCTTPDLHSALHGPNEAVGILDLQAFKQLSRSSPRLRLEPFLEFGSDGE